MNECVLCQQTDALQQTIQQVNSGRFPMVELRQLNDDEIQQLVRLGNQCADWSWIKIEEGLALERVQLNLFLGPVAIARQTESVIWQGVSRPAGIYGSTLSQVLIDRDVLIVDVGLLACYAVLSGAQISRCDVVTHEQGHFFGVGINLVLGPESGGREVPIHPELTVQSTTELALHRDQSDLQQEHRERVSALQKMLRDAHYAYIASHARVTSTSKIASVLVGAGAVIERAIEVSNTILLSTYEQPVLVGDGAIVGDSVLHPGARVEEGAYVRESLLSIHSQTARHGKVMRSMLGPGTQIAEGEVTNSLFGPLVGFHHQALAIGMIWPHGRGNIAYGANVGSNHTGKAPDQEFFAGEGLFFGLGVNVKYPANLMDAPYSVIASAVTLLPQRMCFPFSLINTPDKVYEDFSPAYNELIPGWVLAHNAYAFKRNEYKFHVRYPSGAPSLDLRVLRPATVRKMIEARDLLAQVHGQDIYSPHHLPELGKNYLTESHRLQGIATYDFFIQFFALSALYERALQQDTSADSVLDSVPDDQEWDFVRGLLASMGIQNVRAALEGFVAYYAKLAQSVHNSKAKDDQRGVRIIPDYLQAHTLANEDSFVQQTQKDLEDVKDRVYRLTKQ